MIKGSEGFQIALQFIIQEEVTDKNYYNSHDASPSIPGGKSGITIGIGYDLGQVSPAQFQIDWGNLLSASVMSQLLPFVGKSGLTQSALAPIGGIKIPWDAAVTEFEEQTLPQTIEDTRSIYPQLDDLPSESQAALVSLVYNRGNSLLHKDTMIAIQQDLRNGNLKDIPRQFYAMQPIQKALAPRRQREGNLFAKGLARQSTK
jgi:GH24 family phage-related lysozyme (muramidase)